MVVGESGKLAPDLGSNVFELLGQDIGLLLNHLPSFFHPDFVADRGKLLLVLLDLVLGLAATDSLNEMVVGLEQVLGGGELLKARGRDQLNRRVLHNLFLAILVLVNRHVVVRVRVV